MGIIDPVIRANIENKIAQIEKEEHVEIILAVESSSRAWGFESIDSDYDVRFIYRHQLKWYVNVLPQRDVIELPISDMDDYSGWDIRKALFLLNKSNPVLFEWLNSPIVYKKDNERFKQLVTAAKLYFSPLSSIYHYLHMAKGNYREYLQGDVVKIKKYFYVLRPLLACMWIKEKNESPPMEFDKLLTLIDNKILLEKINELLLRKVYDAVPDRKERFRGAHIIGWIIIAFALLIFLGAFILGAWNGIHNNFSFIEFFIRFLIMLYGMETFDIVFFDWMLLCHSNFFPHFYPEVKDIVGPHLFGFNWKIHVIHYIVYIPICAALAWICILF